ncbi:MAG: Nif3-like dinuclear metal center hexameric protein [Candidatus Nanopelagicales bacterium]
MSTVAQIVEWLSRTYPPRLAESWDAVGLVAGRPAAPVHRILVTVDVTQAVAGQAVAGGYDLIVAHHPLLLGGVTSVAATSAKGRILHDLIEANCALLTAHTNADAAREGVSDALAASLGLAETAPLETSPAIALDHLHVYVPESDAALMLDALAEAGAGAIGNYDRCAFLAPGVGTFRPLPGAAPAIGTVGEVQTVDEVRLEVVLARAARDAVITAMRRAHPYEEPAFGVVELANVSAGEGIGRVGRLTSPMSLSDFAERVAAAVPTSAGGIRVAGELARTVQTVAVCGGSGDSLLADANRAGADVFVTADLKHHRVLDHIEDGGCAVIDVAHWASEALWCDVVADLLRGHFGTAPDTLAVDVSRLVTDPWRLHLGTGHSDLDDLIDPAPDGGSL